ncbi:carbohydrate esterase family 5 protein [Trichoderma chlorosporum]
MPSVKNVLGLVLGQALLTAGNPVDGELIQKRQCPGIHVFGARETTVSSGYGSSATVVNLIIGAYPGTTSEAINYPACGGQSSCGDIPYNSSVITGIQAVVSQVESFHTSCPNTQLVLVGYSQGAQIFDDAFCGGPDTPEGWNTQGIPLSSSAVAAIKAVILMGDPRNIAGLPYNVGTCTAYGFAARPSGYVCPGASLIKSYCDAADPYCCTGNDPNVHQGYGQEYGSQALAFVESKLSSSGSSPPPPPATSSTKPTSSKTGSSPGPTQTQYGQCGGIGYTGPTQCAAGLTCTEYSAYYSQCL